MKALILMTRIPIPGKTKTRLMKRLSGEACAQIHKCFLKDLFNMFHFIKDDIHIFLTYTPENSFQLIENMVPKFITSFPQRGEELGERMANAMEYVLDKGYEKVVLMGSDVPNINPYEIRDAYEILDQNDICIGPTFDGGYYLVGMKELDREVFTDTLKWGNKSVLEGTIDIANNLELKVGLAAKHMDIDTKDDLIAFKEKMDEGELKGEYAPKYTMKFIEKCWGEEYHAKRKIK